MNTTLNTTAKPTNEVHGVEMLYVVLVYTMLENKGFRFNNPCVGVLLRPNLVLTTLSCLVVSFHDAVDIDLTFVYLRNSQVLRPERVFVYPKTEMEGPNVALILLESSKVKDFPKLPEKEFRIGDFEYCTLYGYGSDAETLNLEGFTGMRINRSEVEVCNSYTKGKNWVCLHFTNAMPCRGDVGAPLLCGGALHAIFNPVVAPWAPPDCQDTYSATFTTVYPVVPWIQGINSTLGLPMLAIIDSPWYWIGLGVSTLTIIVVVYRAIMKYVDWACDDELGRDPETPQEDEPRVIYVKSSQMSRVSSRWLWPTLDKT